MSKIKWQRVAGGAGVLLCALGLAAWHRAAENRQARSVRTVVCYQDSMHPWIKSDRPGKCTICSMDLTPIYQGFDGFRASEDVVALSSNNITVLNVQCEPVERQTLRRSLRVAGILDANDSRKRVFSAPAAGRIQEMAVESVGTEVEEGQALLTFFSPELTTWRRTYVVRSRSAAATTALSAGRAHGAGEEDPKQRLGTGGGSGARGAAAAVTEPDPYFSDLLAPQGGTVVERNVYSGQYVAEGDRLLTIVDTSVLWLRLDVYEQQLAWLAPGQKIAVKVAAVPDREFVATISLIEPTLDGATRTVKVRAEIENPVVGEKGSARRLLRLGMYAEGWVQSQVADVLLVPRSAVLNPGGEAYAYVERGAGAYALCPVTLGRQGDEGWEVLEGLRAGDRVVVSGNVLLDAQAQFAAAGKPSRKASSLGISPRRGGHESSASSGDPSDSVGAKPLTAVPTVVLSPSQTKALRQLVEAVDGFGTALASDDVRAAQSQAAAVRRSAEALGQEFSSDHELYRALEPIRSAGGESTLADLEQARRAFLPLSSAVVGLVERLRVDTAAFAGWKIYHCPMAPKPGLWLQARGPLRNPFFGSRMLGCGEEVMASGAGPAPVAAPEPSVSVAAEVKPDRAAAPLTTKNLRHPEASERLMLTFAAGLAAQHRAREAAAAGVAAPLEVASQRGGGAGTATEGTPAREEELGRAGILRPTP